MACPTRQTAKNEAPDGWVAAGQMTTCSSLSASTLPRVSLRLPKKKYRDALDCCPVSEGQERATHTNTRGLNCGYVDIVIAVFMLSVAVGVTMGVGFVI